MKNKFLNIIKLMNIKLFVILFLISIIAISVNIYSQKDLLPILDNQNYSFNYFDILIYALFDKNFLLITILIPNLIITLNIYKRISSMSNYVLRLDTRKDFYNSIFDKIYKVNCWWYFLILFFYFLITLFLNHSFSILYNPQYNTFNIIYLFFVIFRIFLITQILSLLSAGIVAFSSNKWSIIFNVLIYSSFYLYVFDFSIKIASFKDFSFHISDYFTMIQYSSFSRELGFSVVYILLLLGILGLMYKIIISKRGRDLL